MLREALWFVVLEASRREFWTAFFHPIKARGPLASALVKLRRPYRLRAAIAAVMFARSLRRCRVHSMRDVLDQAFNGLAGRVATAFRLTFVQLGVEQVQVLAAKVGRQSCKVDAMLRPAAKS